MSLAYVVTGTDGATAQELMKLALPLLKKWGAPIDTNTVTLSTSFTLNENGDPSDASPITFYFPAFDNLREKDLKGLADELAQALGVPCHTLDAPVIARFPKHVA